MTEEEDLDEEQQPDEAFGLEAFRNERGRDLESFQSIHGKAFLLLRRAGEKRLRVPSRPGRTLATPISEIRDELPPSRYLVYPIRKTERSLIARFYSVGQTRNNDVVIRDVSVSKFHAFFQNDADGAFVLQDARSTNGTYVNGVIVPSQGHGDPVSVVSGDIIRFGTVELSFLSAVEFLGLVRAIVHDA